MPAGTTRLRVQRPERITGANAGRLRPCGLSRPGAGRTQGQPLVVENTMYVVTPYPNVLSPSTSLARAPAKGISSGGGPQPLGIACCDAINRRASTPPAV